MKKISILKFSAISAIILIAVAIFAIGAHSENRVHEARDSELSQSLLSDEKTVFASEDVQDYNLIFSSDSMQADQNLAKEIESLVRELYSFRMRPNADTSTRVSEKEILIGSTTRPESSELLRAIKSKLKNSDDLAWGFAVLNGKLCYAANSDIAFAYGAEDFLKYLADSDFTLSSELLVINTKNRAEYDAQIKAEEDAKREMILAELRETNSAFTQGQFGGEPLSMGKSPYSKPDIYPTKGQHPRIFITEDKLDDVLEIMRDERYASIVRTFWSEADEDCDGIFPRVEYNDPNNQYENWDGDDFYQYDTHIISVIQNKAFAYLITKDEIYGYEAIIGVKNMILTLNYSTYIHMDLYHGSSHLMVAVAKIYDWCYDLLSDDDKRQIIGGVSNILAPHMESGMRFPPSGMSPVSGHGTGPQFLRDWMMIAISFFDEMPDWWEFVGGRYFQEYVPVVNEHTKNGWVTQGTAVYGPGKFYDAIVSARLLYLSTGQFPYDEEGIKLTAYYIMSHIQPNGKYFQTGDGPRNTVGGSVEVIHLYDVAATFGDRVITTQLYNTTNNMNKAVNPDWGSDFCAGKVLAYLAYLPEPLDGKFYEEVDKIQYFAHPAGTMTARNTWGEDGAAAYMKIGTMTMANHDIYDHGTFQIYYKGLLAGTSGAYSKYGSNSHKYYLQATVGHNGILVFNPIYAAEKPALGSDDPLDITNGASYFYSGSQRSRTQAGSLNYWLSGEYNMGEITGYDISYSSAGESEYGYIAGDITKSYHDSTVSFLERRMLSVFTGDPDYPMLFFTFDTVESLDASFEKTYLLHTTKEPAVDETTLSANIKEGEGRLYVQSLFGAQKIEKIGGEGQAFWINGYTNKDGKYIEGKNCIDKYTTTDYASKFWGRIQYTASGERETQMLTAMFVTDASNEETPVFGKFENESVYGASFDGVYSVFLKNRDRQFKEFSFNTEGKGLSRYYISGIEAGTWKVYTDGVAVATVDVGLDAGFASFIAPSGSITLKPTENVVGINGGKINYITLGGTIADTAPYVYNNEADTPLPTNVTRDGDTFLGWYLSPSYNAESQISTIKKGTEGNVTVYARWRSVFVDEDYTETVVDHGATNKMLGGINYNGSSKDGSYFLTKKDENGVNYLEFTEGSKDPLITVTNAGDKCFANIADEEACVSFQLHLAKQEGKAIMPFNFRIMSNVEYLTGKDRVWGELVIFSGDSSGTVRLGKSGSVIGSIADGSILEIRLAVDFVKNTLTAYDKDGKVITSDAFTVPSGSGAPNAIEWRKLMKQYLAYFYPQGGAESGGVMRIYKFKIAESNIFV